MYEAGTAVFVALPTAPHLPNVLSGPACDSSRSDIAAISYFWPRMLARGCSVLVVLISEIIGFSVAVNPSMAQLSHIDWLYLACTVHTVVLTLVVHLTATSDLFEPLIPFIVHETYLSKGPHQKRLSTIDLPGS